MPDPPFPPKPIRPQPNPVSGARTDGIAYAELHCRMNYSFLEGAFYPDELVQQAASLGLRGPAITDRNSLAGVVRTHAAQASFRFEDARCGDQDGERAATDGRGAIFNRLR